MRCAAGRGEGPEDPPRQNGCQADADGGNRRNRSPMSLELVCPAGTPAALRAAIDAGADTMYCGFRDCTNARNYPGLNFDVQEMAEGVAYAHRRGRRVLPAATPFPRAGDAAPWHAAIDNAAAVGVDAVILADIG